MKIKILHSTSYLQKFLHARNLGMTKIGVYQSNFGTVMYDEFIINLYNKVVVLIKIRQEVIYACQKPTEFTYRT